MPDGVDFFSPAFHKRKAYWYVQFKRPDGTYTTAKSTHQKKLDLAKRWAHAYQAEGNLNVKDRRLFSDFAGGMFDEGSEYLRLRQLNGEKVGDSHRRNLKRYLEKEFLPYFGRKRLDAISVADIDQFRLHLSAKGLADLTVTHTINALKLVFNYAGECGLLSRNPFQVRRLRLKKTSDKPKGILTQEQSRRVFALEWRDGIAYAASILAATTGMRQGEILALRRKDISGNRIVISSSWERGNGLKGTKTGIARVAHMPDRTRAVVERLIAVSPFTGDDTLVFHSSTRPGVPVDHKRFSTGLYEALALIGLDEATRKSSNITFHSWRHFFNTHVVNRFGKTVAQTLTGHSSDRMTEHYYHGGMESEVMQYFESIVSCSIGA